jgi:hypothetical protein
MGDYLKFVVIGLSFLKLNYHLRMFDSMNYIIHLFIYVFVKSSTIIALFGVYFAFAVLYIFSLITDDLFENDNRPRRYA